jgi:hypothetical protein
MMWFSKKYQIIDNLFESNSRPIKNAIGNTLKVNLFKKDFCKF